MGRVYVKEHSDHAIPVKAVPICGSETSSNFNHSQNESKRYRKFDGNEICPKAQTIAEYEALPDIFSRETLNLFAKVPNKEQRMCFKDLCEKVIPRRKLSLAKPARALTGRMENSDPHVERPSSDRMRNFANEQERILLELYQNLAAWPTSIAFTP